MRYLAWIAGLGVSCGGPVEELGETEEAVTNATATTAAPEVVRLAFGDGTGCTGIALTQRLIVTAGHCVDGYSSSYGTGRVKVYYYSSTTGTGTRVYPSTNVFGRASYFVHPDYDTWPDIDHDVGLIVLYDGGLSTYDRARIYMDDREPWDPGSSESNTVNVIATGTGSGPGGAVDCDDSSLTYGTKRRGSQFTVQDVPFPGYVDSEMSLSMNGQHACAGDSGGAYTLYRDGYYMTFAVHSSHTEDYWYDTAHGMGLRAHLAWLLATATSAGAPVTVVRYHTGEYEFQRWRH
jgi:hypothetical protein